MCVEGKWLARVVKVRSSVLPVFVCVCVCVHVHVVMVMAFCDRGLCVDGVLGVSRWYLGDQ